MALVTTDVRCARMIRPQVPLRQPCYDFSFLQTVRLAGLRADALRTARQTAQSVGATGGVYKGQGRNRRPVVAGAYGTFLVRGGQLQAPVPTTPAVHEWLCPQAKQRCVAGIVVRVRPRVSRGITDLLARPRSSSSSLALAQGRSSRSLTR